MKKVLSILAICFMFALSFPATAPAPVCDDDNCNTCSWVDNICVCTPVDCSDGIACTDDSCDLVDGCANTPVDALCDDEDTCTDNYCDPEDGNSDPVTGCVFVDNNTCDEICDPKTQGYWYRQCLGLPAWLPGGSKGPGIDPGRNGRGPKEPTEPGFADELMTCANAKLEDLGFFGVTTCEGMDADLPNDSCEKALKQLTALILNICSERLSVSCEVDVDCSGENVGELIGYIADLIPGECKQAADCADMVNTGDGLVD